MRALLKQPTLLPLPQGEHMCTENTNTRQEKNKTRNKLIDVSGKIVATTPSERIHVHTRYKTQIQEKNTNTLFASSS